VPQNVKALLNRDLPQAGNGAYKPAYKQKRKNASNEAKKLFYDLAEIVKKVLSFSGHYLTCPVRMFGTYELTAFHKSCNIQCLHGLECWLSEPEVMFTGL